MSTVAAIGETHEIEGFALVGARVIGTETSDGVIAAWQNLDRDVGLVILSSRAAETLLPMLADRPDTLTLVMP